MGAGASAEFAQAIAPNTNKRHGRGKRKAAQKAQADMNRQLLEKYDKDKTGALTREEVRAFAEDVLSHYTPVMGGVTEADIDMVMRLGGETTKDEVKADELPQARETAADATRPHPSCRRPRARARAATARAPAAAAARARA